MITLTNEQFIDLKDLICDLGNENKTHRKYSTFYVDIALLLTLDYLKAYDLPKELEDIEAQLSGIWDETNGFESENLYLNKVTLIETVEDYDTILLELVDDNKELFSKEYVDKLRKSLIKINILNTEKVNFEVIKE